MPLRNWDQTLMAELLKLLSMKIEKKIEPANMVSLSHKTGMQVCQRDHLVHLT